MKPIKQIVNEVFNQIDLENKSNTPKEFIALANDLEFTFCYKGVEYELVGKDELRQLNKKVEKALNLAIQKDREELQNKVDALKKETLETIRVVIKLYPHKHGDELFSEIAERIDMKEIFNLTTNTAPEEADIRK